MNSVVVRLGVAWMNVEGGDAHRDGGGALGRIGDGGERLRLEIGINGLDLRREVARWLGSLQGIFLSLVEHLVKRMTSTSFGSGGGFAAIPRA